MASQPMTPAALKRLAMWYRRKGLLDRSERLLRVVLCMQERQSGAETMASALTLYQLGEVLSDQDKHDQARICYTRATAIYEEQHLVDPDQLWHLSALIQLHDMAEQEMTRFEEADDAAVA